MGSEGLAGIVQKVCPVPRSQRISLLCVRCSFNPLSPVCRCWLMLLLLPFVQVQIQILSSGPPIPALSLSLLPSLSPPLVLSLSASDCTRMVSLTFYVRMLLFFELWRQEPSRGSPDFKPFHTRSLRAKRDPSSVCGFVRQTVG